MAARFTVVRVAGDRALTDQEVFDLLELQMRRSRYGECEMSISVKATEDQVDKAMRVLMMRVAQKEIRQIRREL